MALEWNAYGSFAECTSVFRGVHVSCNARLSPHNLQCVFSYVLIIYHHQHFASRGCCIWLFCVIPPKSHVYSAKEPYVFCGLQSVFSDILIAMSLFFVGTSSSSRHDFTADSLSHAHSLPHPNLFSILHLACTHSFFLLLSCLLSLSVSVSRTRVCEGVLSLPCARARSVSRPRSHSHSSAAPLLC